MIFPQDNNQRKFCCFVCAEIFNTYPEMRDHIIEGHEEGREYLVCPLKHCGCPVRDLRLHFRTKHPSVKCPQNGQLRATVMYDTKNPNKKRKLPNFKEGYIISEKNNGKQLHYRSGYELEVYESLEKIGDVLRYEVEPFSVEYFFRAKKKQYFPDLLVEYSDGAIEIWEIKPANQCKLMQNQSKWNAAKHHCQLRGWSFQVISEDDIMNLKKKAGYGENKGRLNE